MILSLSLFKYQCLLSTTNIFYYLNSVVLFLFYFLSKFKSSSECVGEEEFELLCDFFAIPKFFLEVWFLKKNLNKKISAFQPEAPNIFHLQ